MNEALWVVISCILTLTVTSIFNWIINSPKRRKEKEEKQKQELDEKLAQVEKRLNKRFDEVVNLRAEERKACGEDHKVVLSNLSKIQAENQAQSERLEAQSKGLQAVIKNDLKIRYLKWVKLGYAPMDAKDDLEKMYQVYHNLGANGVMDSLREQFLELPNNLPRKRTKDTADVELEISKEEEDF